MNPTQASRRRGLSRALPYICVVLLSGGLATAAERPRIYAITGANVVPAPGQRIESASVVIRDGLIEAVGQGVAVPPDAVEIDGAGRWVYAGLIDADSRLGLKSQSAGSGGAGPPGAARREETPSGAVHPIARIKPETAARDLLLPFSGERRKEVERIRDLGFTVVLASPEQGILRGTSAAILLSDDRAVAELILRDDVAQHAAFERGGFGQGYPTSLMGAVAAIRQAMLDAERYQTWSARYAANPVGMNRPELHAAFEELIPLLEGSQPMIFQTEDPQDTLLAHRLGQEFDLRMVLSISSHEWEMASRLADAGRPLIVSVAFPEKPDVKDADEALEVSREEMRRYLDAAAGPARLNEAGVTFALSMRGLKNPADFPKQMRQIIEAGLPEEVALAALTTVPARIMGIDRMVGTLESGKIANLVVADGPLFAEETKLRHVFVDGVEYEIEVKEKPKGDPDAVVDPRGEWSVVFDMGARTINRVWTITGDKDAYGGTAETQSGTVSFDSVELVGNAMTVVFPARGGRPSMEVTVIIEGEEFEGVAEFGPRSVTITGTRTSGPRGGAR